MMVTVLQNWLFFFRTVEQCKQMSEQKGMNERTSECNVM